MSYTSKTFNQLQASVLKSMNDLNLAPIEILSLTKNAAMNAAQRYAEKYLAVSLRQGDPSQMKRLRAFMDSAGNCCYDFNIVGSPHSEEDGEYRFTYSVDFDRQDGLYLQKRSKRGVSLGRVLGDFDDGLMLNLQFDGDTYIRSYHGVEALKTEGMPQSELIKYFVNKFKAQSKNAFVYFTDVNIDQHYKSLSQVRDLDTCLSRKNSHYHRKVKGTYYHPLRILNKSPNVRLALLSNTHHSEWEDGQYPFVGRCLVKMDELGKVTGLSRYYGHEKFSRDSLSQAFNTREGVQGGVFKAVYDDENELILFFADQLTSDSEEKNAVSWIDNPSPRWFDIHVGREFSSLKNRKDLLVMGNTNRSFGVTPSFDGREVTTCSNAKYVRNDRPKPDKYSDYVYSLEYGVIRASNYDLTFNIALNDFVVDGDILHRSNTGDGITHYHVEKNLYVQTIFHDWVLRDEVILFFVAYSSCYVPIDNDLGIIYGQEMGTRELEELIADTIAA
jgi:hypothetical protein